MAVLALSDLLLAATLLVNAGAVLNYKLSPHDPTRDSIRDRLLALLASLRIFRTLLALWNVFLVLLMFIWFT